MPRGRPRLTEAGYYDGPPIPLTMECQKYRQDCKLGSILLGGAIRDLLCRMEPDAAVAVLGGPRKPTPGTERVYKTASIERMAA